MRSIRLTVSGAVAPSALALPDSPDIDGADAIRTAQVRQDLVFHRILDKIGAMTNACFFGYGSLVNRATHDYQGCRPAVLTGWRRMWRHTTLRPAAYLTSIPVEGAAIDGLVAPVPGGDWAALDEREHAYDRSNISHLLRDAQTHPTEVHVYSIPEGRHGAPTEDHPILLSYLDVVVQGYLREFGEDGVARFFDTTDGWEAPIRDDRRDPVYPRHRKLADSETDLVNHYLKTLDMRVI